MHNKRNPLFQMKAQEPQLQDPLHLHPDLQSQESSLLSQISETKGPLFIQPPNLLTQMHSLESLEDLRLMESAVFQEVLVDCNSLVEAYWKEEILKATVYIEIQSKLAKALSDNRGRLDSAFGSFIATIKSHDSEVTAAASKGKAFNPLQRSPSSVVLISDGESDRERDAKRVKVDESAYAWIANRQHKCNILRDTLTKTLKLIETYTINPKATKHSLINKPDCPEFPDSEWKNIISG